MNLLIGFFAGLIASMGLGGGFVMIIYLTVFRQCTQLEAQGANLLFFLPIALLSMFLHTRSGLIDWRRIPFAAAAGIVGALIGTFLGAALDESLLQKLFAALLLITGLRELFHGRKAESAAQ